MTDQQAQIDQVVRELETGLIDDEECARRLDAIGAPEEFPYGLKDEVAYERYLEARDDARDHYDEGD